MFKIGEFSRFSRVSVKMLRHYDEIGLLRPAHVDPFTNYRYYTADQLPHLNRIILLKDLDFSLEQIAEFLNEELSFDEIRGVLKLKRAEIKARMQADRQRLAVLERVTMQLKHEMPLLSHVVIVREITAQWVVSIRRHISFSDDVSTLFEQLEATVARYDARATAPPLMIYHDMEFVEGRQDVEVVVPVVKGFDPPEDVQTYTLPGGKMACIVYTGDYTNTDPLIRQFPGWLAANGCRAAGPLREVYLRFGADNVGYTLPDAYLADVAAAYVTELQLPFEVDA